MGHLEITFDILISLFVLVMVWKALATKDLYQSAIFFIAFGLAIAMAWARLSAPDVALAEAAIGAGILGVLLLDSIRIFVRPGNHEDVVAESEPVVQPPQGKTIRRVTGAFIVLGGLALAGTLLAAILAIPEGEGLTTAVADNMEASGVDHPVTAVLLNFRGFDTWLEIGVLLLAMLGIFCAGGRTGFGFETKEPKRDILIDHLARALVPLLVLTAGYLLWLGKFAPGGAFQAGVILGAAGILMRLAGFRLFGGLPSWLWRIALVFGFAVFLLHGAVAIVAGRAFLEYPAQYAGDWIFVIEAAAAFSIAFTLAAFFIYLNASDPVSGLEDKNERSASS